MKLSLIFLSIFLSSVASADCDLALIKGKSNGVIYNYNDEVFEAFEKKGYRAYEVDNAYEAGLTNSNYIAYFEAQCAPNIFNPFTTSTVTTLTVAREKGLNYETFVKVSSKPQIAVGSCKIELESLIAKVPRCK